MDEQKLTDEQIQTAWNLLCALAQQPVRDWKAIAETIFAAGMKSQRSIDQAEAEKEEKAHLQTIGKPWPAKTVPHDYLSTACYHQEHVRCRKQCKFCGVPCKCSCHAAKQQAEPVSDPIEILRYIVTNTDSGYDVLASHGLDEARRFLAALDKEK